MIPTQSLRAFIQRNISHAWRHYATRWDYKSLSIVAVMARYDWTYALAHAATLILAVGAIYILLDACEPLPLFHRTIRKTFSSFRRGAGVCVAWCRFNAFMTAIRFAGGRLYAWICVIEFQSLVRDNFDRVGTYKKVFGSFGLMDVKRGGRKHPELPNVLGQRNAGVPVETPEVTTGFLSALDAGGTLRVRAAFWLPLLALFNARVRLNWQGSLWPMSRQSRRHKRRCSSSLNGRPPIV